MKQTKTKLLCLLIAALMLLSLAACGKETTKDSNLIKLGDYELLYKGACIMEDSDGNYAIVLTLDFTNNGKENASYLWSVDETVMQNGVELEVANVFTDYDTFETVIEGQFTEIAPGTTLEVKTAYVLKDAAAKVEATFEQLFGKKKGTITIDPATLSRETADDMGSDTTLTATTGDALLDWWNGAWYGWWTMTGWDDFAADYPDDIPNYYDDWYLPLVESGSSMPDVVGGEAVSSNSADAPAAPTAANVSGGDGIVTEEQVQKGYVWMNEVNNNIFDATYDDIAAYFGVEGQFVKEEYSDHMKANYRYYKWISEDDGSHFIYVNFKENESGVYTVSAYNTSGFSGKEAIAKYLDIVKAEAAEANKAASANAEMKDFSVEVAQFAQDDVKVKIMTKIPVSGWSYDDGKRSLVENDDPTAFGAGAIRFEVRENVEKFDYYKDNFENYQDIEDRVIGGITFRGRTYRNIGYDWIEYVAQLDDNRALSIGLRNMDCVPGTMPDIILNNMTFQ